MITNVITNVTNITIITINTIFELVFTKMRCFFKYTKKYNYLHT